MGERQRGEEGDSEKEWDGVGEWEKESGRKRKKGKEAKWDCGRGKGKEGAGKREIWGEEVEIRRKRR
jgi:hypothetical protein